MATAGSEIDLDRLVEACGEASEEAGITIHTFLEPLGGPHDPVKPATYIEGRFQEDERWWGDPPQRTAVIVIDTVPSQANRLEAALSRLRPELGLPELVLDLGNGSTLPSHLPKRISSFRFPHRQADAYLRDAELDGRAFPATPLGRSLLNATSDQADPLLQWFPQALLFGYWQSHLGKKRMQSKLARSWVSEIAGYSPATNHERHTWLTGTKGDPINLAAEERVEYDEDDLLAGWDLVSGSRPEGDGGRKAKPKKDKLSAIGHGQVPYSDEALAGVSFRRIEQRATVSFSGLRRIQCKESEHGAVARALLVSLGLAAHVEAFGRAFSLRSGCDLRPVHTTWTWLGSAADESISPLSPTDARQLVRGCLGRLGGIIEGGGWGKEPLVLKPGKALKKAVDASWPLRD